MAGPLRGPFERLAYTELIIGLLEKAIGVNLSGKAWPLGGGVKHYYSVCPGDSHWLGAGDRGLSVRWSLVLVTTG